MHGHHPETHNYRSARARAGLETPRRPSLVVQKIYRLGGGVANERRRRAMTKTVERHEHLDGGRETVRFGERRADEARVVWRFWTTLRSPSKRTLSKADVSLGTSRAWRDV